MTVVWFWLTLSAGFMLGWIARVLFEGLSGR